MVGGKQVQSVKINLFKILIGVFVSTDDPPINTCRFCSLRDGIIDVKFFSYRYWPLDLT